MQRGDDRRDHGGDAQGLGGALVGLEVDQRAQPELVGGDRHGGAYPPERRPGRRGERLEHRDERRRQRAGGGDLGAEGGQLGGVGQVAACDEVPCLLEAAVAGELGGVEAAVVEEAGLAVDVADGGVGDGDAVEAGGDVDQGGHGFDRRLDRRR